MKHQQVVIDYWTMVKTSVACLILIFAGYILIKLVQMIFWLPKSLQNNQRRLEKIAEIYKEHLKQDPEEKEIAGLLLERIDTINEVQDGLTSPDKKDL